MTYYVAYIIPYRHTTRLNGNIYGMPYTPFSTCVPLIILSSVYVPSSFPPPTLDLETNYSENGKSWKQMSCNYLFVSGLDTKPERYVAALLLHSICLCLPSHCSVHSARCRLELGCCTRESFHQVVTTSHGRIYSGLLQPVEATRHSVI